MQLTGRHYQTGEPVTVSMADGRITEISSAPTDDNLPWIAPGLFDIQINGYGGVWFSDERLTVDQTLEVLHAHYQHGITRMFPTLITNSFEALEHGFATIGKACEQEPWANHMVAGCHLEGPYIGHEDGPRGAHPLEHVRDCDLNEFEKLQAASGGRIRLVTLAPERGNAVDFVRGVTGQGIIVAIGHTAANTEQITAAVDAGARLSTHLGNGAHGILPRHPNYIWDQLGEPRLTASIIADGHHLPASVVRSIYFAKGKQKTILTCDASGLAGCPPGEYDYHGGRFEILDSGKIVVAGQRQYLAGSGVQTEVCVAKMIEMTGCTLADAWEMATTNPAKLMRTETGTLETGAIADATVFRHSPDREHIEILETISQGVRRFSCD
ncbi:MAG: amidohydrolase family protein [Planctomycetaceae bacterium]|nr:amidohydrolase family protein [Planctomycetaceae bacterium]